MQNKTVVRLKCFAQAPYIILFRPRCLSDFKSLIEEWGLLEREGLFHVKAPGNPFVTWVVLQKTEACFAKITVAAWL